MPNGDQQTQQTAPVPPPPDHLADLRIRPAEDSTWQTIKRNLTPQMDVSRSSLGPGHEFDTDSPQMGGEQTYRENFGSPLKRAYGHAKTFLAQHEQHLSDRVLKPFRAGLDQMATDLERAGETGHTHSGGALTNATRALAVGTGAMLRMVPVGRDVKETVGMAIAPPEFGPEGKALSKEIKVARAAEKVHEPVGIHEDDVPRGAKTPDVDWAQQDLQDRARKVTEETVAQDYGPKRRRAKFSVYKSHIPMEDLPTAKIVEEEETDPELRNDNWREDYQGILRRTTPPIKVRVTPKNEIQILDGNHRAKIWEDANMTHVPAWVVDERGKNIEQLSEEEKAERTEAEEERQAQSKNWEPHKLESNSQIPHQPGYVYHATNLERAHDIANSGKLDVHKPSYGTDQDVWPDGTTEKRSYFSKNAAGVWHFAPEEGKPVILRTAHDPAIHKTESTGDIYSTKKVPAEKLEVFGNDKQWHPISEFATPKAATKKELPPQPRLPDTGTHAAIKTDEGSIYFDDAPQKQRTHIMLAQDLGIPPERIVSGGWLKDGEYQASERSDAGRWGEQARAQTAVAEKRAKSTPKTARDEITAKAAAKLGKK